MCINMVPDKVFEDGIGAVWVAELRRSCGFTGEAQTGYTTTIHLASEAFGEVGVEGEEVVAVVAAPRRPSQASLSVLVRTWNTEQTAPEPCAHYAKLPTLLPSHGLTVPTQHFLPSPTM
ncbi:hypothetical protein EYF80_002689 [Liparis tanakae]|uniref:Uncharacterized protein n=1 Tax=Liparis tanakae TaxID=230148 RepID=A0A4Z2JAT5_9TELE|nr:hypothetical protein EYF80_002689 [Liparis tanakae]